MSEDGGAGQSIKNVSRAEIIKVRISSGVRGWWQETEGRWMFEIFSHSTES